MKKQVMQLAWQQMEQTAPDEAEILIYSQISDWKWGDNDPDVTAQEFDKLLKGAKASGATKLRVRINSPGGSVSQAVAMKTMLMNSDFEEINIDIEGLCASAATFFVCVPGAHVRIAEGSEFMIHRPSMCCWGNTDDFQRAYNRLNGIQTEQYAMYAARTGKSEEQIKEWMDAETWFTAKEAVENGFADEVICAAPVTAQVSEEMLGLMRERYSKMPKEILTPKQKAQPAKPEANKKTEEDNMDIKEITEELLHQENAALYQAIAQRGAEAERQRIADIESLCDEGYEELAQKAKQDGTSVADFVRQLVAAKKEKKKDYLQQRQQETAPAKNVFGGGAGEQTMDDDDAELAKLAKESAAIAAGMKSSGGWMY